MLNIVLKLPTRCFPLLPAFDPLLPLPYPDITTYKLGFKIDLEKSLAAKQLAAVTR